jgi:hypothetical protein
MQQNDVRQLRRVKDLTYCFANWAMQIMHPRVNQRGALVSNQKLIECDSVLRLPG